MYTPFVKGLAERIMALLNDEPSLLLTETNDSNIEALDMSLKIIEELTSIVLDRFKAHQTRVRRRRNALLSINRLPEEVLTLLFETTMEFDEDSEMDESESGKRRAALGAVCFSWHQCVDQTPALWTTLSNKYPIQVIKKALEKSRTLPLRAIVDQVGGSAEEIWTAISPHFDRCQRIDALACRTLSRLICGGSTGLEDLHMLGVADPPPRFHYVAGDDPLPRIRRLWLSNVSFPWRRLPLPNLVSLNLHELTDLSFSHLMEMLGSSPSLVKLDLGYMGLPDNPDKLEKLCSIPLARLGQLFLKGLDSQVVLCLLAALQPPTLHSLWITPIAPPFDDLPQYIAESVENAISDASYVSVTLQLLGGYTIDSEPRPRCRIGGVDVDGLERWLGRIRESNNAVPFLLFIQGNNRLVPEFVKIKSLQSIVNVTLDVPAIPSFFDAICIPMADGRWALPKLSAITIRGRASTFLSLEGVPELFKQRRLSSSVSLVTSLTYHSDSKDSLTLSWLARLVAGSPRCKIYRKTPVKIFEETVSAGLASQL